MPTEDLKEVFEELSEDVKRELDDLGEILKESVKGKDPNTEIKNKKIKDRIAKICLKLIEDTSKDERGIMETSYVITGYFIWYNLGDLTDIIGEAGELELPAKHVHGDVFKRFDKMKKMFEKYLS
jgi:hypothetical protein